jgi:glycosyltransferase involved in cell wall biosynthesis
MVRRALAHDYLYVHGGAERTLAVAHEIWPEAPIHTLLYLRDRLPADPFGRMDIRTTWVDRLPARSRLARLYGLLQPLAFSGIRTGADEVVSFASFGAKAIAPAAGGRHLCYCFTPPRFLWGLDRGTDLSGRGAAVRAADAVVRTWLRRWDRDAAARVTHFIAQSRAVDERIARVYGRRAGAIVYPPVAVERFAARPTARGDAFLAVARLEAFKRLDLAITACRRVGVPLRIVGTGVDAARLHALAEGDPLITFLGGRTDAEIAHEMATCRAFLHPAEEDFGIAAVEAQAAGSPVIAFAGGGAMETVIEGVTGTFFDEANTEALAAAIVGFDPARYHPDDARANAARFTPDRFRAALAAAVVDLGARPRQVGRDTVVR